MWVLAIFHQVKVPKRSKFLLKSNNIGMFDHFGPYYHHHHHHNYHYLISIMIIIIGTLFCHSRNMSFHVSIWIRRPERGEFLEEFTFRRSFLFFAINSSGNWILKSDAFLLWNDLVAKPPKPPHGFRATIKNTLKCILKLYLNSVHCPSTFPF